MIGRHNATAAANITGPVTLALHLAAGTAALSAASQSIGGAILGIIVAAVARHTGVNRAQRRT